MKPILRYLSLSAQATWHHQVEEQLQHLHSLTPITAAEVILEHQRAGKPAFRDLARIGSAQRLGRLTAMKKVKRVLVALVGGTVLALGIALVVLPGPAFLVIPAGLAMLAVEFAWLRRWLRKARGWLPGKPVPGGAGDSPILPGDSPGGTGTPSATRKTAACKAHVSVVSVDGSPTGAGASRGWPAFGTHARPRRASASRSTRAGMRRFPQRRDPAEPDHAILEVLQCGYRRGEQVFRPAEVVVNDLTHHRGTPHAR